MEVVLTGRALLLIAALALAACVSSFAESYVGRTAADLQLDNGPPANIVELPGGRRSYQYYWGGGEFVVPQTTTSNVVVTSPNTAQVNTVTTGGHTVRSEGCLVNFITERRGESWVIVEARWPQRLVC